MTSGTSTEGFNAWLHLKAVHTLWLTNFLHDSYSGWGSKIWAYVHVGTNWTNARSNAGCLRFGDGWATNDIVGHEFTHSVDDFHGGLIYQVERRFGAPFERMSNLGARWIELRRGEWHLGDRVDLLHGVDVTIPDQI